MINLKDAQLSRLCIHRVGCQNDNEDILFSESETNLSDPLLKGLLQRYFFDGFKDHQFYQLTHSSDLELNETYHYVSQIIENPDNLYGLSRDIARYLHECSDHPNIKSGDFCIAWIENCSVNGEYADAVGLFKVESKDTFLKIAQDFSVIHDQGINISKIDKGCLIFNYERDQGFLVSIIDNTNKNNEARYWKEDFLKVKPREDSFFHTKSYMQLCKNFCTEVLDKKEQVEKTDQIDFLNRSSGFFSNKETFNIREFEEEVIADPEIIDKFRGFKTNFQENSDVNMFDEFAISNQAVKGTKRVFKSVLKLDKNFHIYVHGNRSLIERGYDDHRQMHYYKVYFTEESS